ncbi:S8 family peptidase [Aquibacillus sediminis]|uniref:S8 family peptidase n=1 Tax=Aquibacillus sediminis TaxID=2574734 RepID=UPI001109FA44|nr:S8 family serine peptidase [Aquibacillus sediminis]
MTRLLSILVVVWLTACQQQVPNTEQDTSTNYLQLNTTEQGDVTGQNAEDTREITDDSSDSPGADDPLANDGTNEVQQSESTIEDTIDPEIEENGEIRVMMLVEENSSPEQVIQTYDGTVEQTYEEMNMIAGYVPRQKISDLEQDQRVTHLEYDKVMEINSTQVVEWGSEAIQSPLALSSNFTGEGVKVAVLDTGIADHEDVTITAGVSMVDYTNSYQDDHGHGTQVAGIIGAKPNDIGIVGVAPASELYAVKVLGQDGTGYTSDVIAGIDWAIQQDMDIMNISLGAERGSPLMESYIRQAIDQNIVVIAAAGNDGTPAGTEDNVGYPARYSQVIAVGATNQSNQRADFSSTGQAVEIAAPGEAILSTHLHNKYARVNGTSFASPYVAGVAALIKQLNPSMTVSQIRKRIQQESIDLGPTGRDSWYGYGLTQAPYYFRDIYGSWARSDIVAVREKGWMNGANQYFYPSRSLTRAEAAAIFVRMLDLPISEQTETTFTDVSSRYWAAREIQTVVDHGIMYGINSSTFSPNQNLTREQMAVMLHRALDPDDQEVSNPFEDVSANRWSYQSIVTLKHIGVINGVNATTFAPKRSIQRAEMAAMLNRIAKYMGANQ